ncbi:MAG: hypothetical protein Ta2A_11270 [Treponemataceae bacterium]|nr:MAG: hypothetical protein Ta2A_11270 [Treponemataceae bacterium]
MRNSVILNKDVCSGAYWCRTGNHSFDDRCGLLYCRARLCAFSRYPEYDKRKTACRMLCLEFDSAVTAGRGMDVVSVVKDINERNKLNETQTLFNFNFESDSYMEEKNEGI